MTTALVGAENPAQILNALAILEDPEPGSDETAILESLIATVSGTDFQRSKMKAFLAIGMQEP